MDYSRSRPTIRSSRRCSLSAKRVCGECGVEGGMEPVHWSCGRLWRERPEDLLALCGECREGFDRARITYLTSTRKSRRERIPKQMR